MLQIRNLHVSAAGHEILRGIDLTVNAGEVHAIMGPNGSGKSTLAQVLAGREDYEITAGEVRYEGQDLLEMAPEDRAHEGIFLAFQYPVEIPGVSTTYVLSAAVNATRAAHPDRPLLRYTADLVDPAAAAAEVALLKAVALRYVMSDPGRLAMQARQRELLVELATALRDRAPESLDPVFAADWKSAPDDAARLRVVLDQVAILTDQQAIARLQVQRSAPDSQHLPNPIRARCRVARPRGYPPSQS
jgi:ABC-type branched-subunit amino acid transport system ATPase component